MCTGYLLSPTLLPICSSRWRRLDRFCNGDVWLARSGCPHPLEFVRAIFSLLRAVRVVQRDLCYPPPPDRNLRSCPVKHPSL
jgi:hypothetical protein